MQPVGVKQVRVAQIVNCPFDIFPRRVLCQHGSDHNFQGGLARPPMLRSEFGIRAAGRLRVSIRHGFASGRPKKELGWHNRYHPFMFYRGRCPAGTAAGFHTAAGHRKCPATPGLKTTRRASPPKIDSYAAIRGIFDTPGCDWLHGCHTRCVLADFRLRRPTGDAPRRPLYEPGVRRSHSVGL